MYSCMHMRTLLARTSHHPEPASSLAVRPGPTQEQARATLRESKGKAHFFLTEHLFINDCHLVNIFVLKNNAYREHLRAI